MTPAQPEVIRYVHYGSSGPFATCRTAHAAPAIGTSGSRPPLIAHASKPTMARPAMIRSAARSSSLIVAPGAIELFRDAVRPNIPSSTLLASRCDGSHNQRQSTRHK